MDLDVFFHTIQSLRPMTAACHFAKYGDICHKYAKLKMTPSLRVSIFSVGRAVYVTLTVTYSNKQKMRGISGKLHRVEGTPLMKFSLCELFTTVDKYPTAGRFDM